MTQLANARNRADARIKFADLLRAAAVGTGKPCNFVYAERPAKLPTTAKSILVTSAGSRRIKIPRSKRFGTSGFRLEVDVILPAANSAGGRTEAIVETEIDAIEQIIANVVAENEANEVWKSLEFETDFSTVFKEPNLDGGSFVIETLYVIVECPG